jgi:hypothetical protein
MREFRAKARGQYVEVLFVGKRLAYAILEFADEYCELCVRESDCKEENVVLLEHERWWNVARVVVLLEDNNVPLIHSKEPIDLEVEPGITDTVIG